MSEEKDVDLQDVLDRGTKKTTLSDLQQKGFKNVKVLDEKALRELIGQAVEKVVSSQSAEQKAQILADSRKELDRLMKEHKAARSRAQLLEADKNELVEHMEGLQRQLELQSDLEEERLHKKFVEGTASMQAQVEEVKKKAASADAELARLRADNERLEKMVQGEREKLLRMRDLEPRLESALRGAQELQSANEVLERELQDAKRRQAELQPQLANEQSRLREAERARTELVQQVLQLQAKGNDAVRVSKELEAARAGLAKSEELIQQAAKENVALRSRAADLEGRAQGGQLELNRISAESARLESENAKLRGELDHSRAAIAALEGAVAEERAKLQQSGRSVEDLRTRLDEVSERAGLLEKRVGEADRLEVERVHFQTELDRSRAELQALQSIRGERDEAREETEAARRETAELREVLAQQEREKDAQRERTIIVTNELEEIEKVQRQEEAELEALRRTSLGLEEELAKTRFDLNSSHAEINSLQEILQREQDVSRETRNETASLQNRLQDLTSASSKLEVSLRSMEDDNRRLQEQLQQNEAAAGMDSRLGALERLIALALENSGLARASSSEAKGVAALLRKQLLDGGAKKRKKAGASLQGGVALDGVALLQEFFRRIRLKERLHKHVPIRERDGQRHPSQLLVDVVTALIAGDRRANKDKGARLEILGPSRGPDLGELRQFVGRIPPRATHAVSRVHDALRQNLFSMPEKPARLVLDVGSTELPRQYRPLLCFEPETREFWHGQLRTVGDKDVRGIVPFLKDCIGKVPGGFARGRIRFRMDSKFFSEDVVRFLTRRSCSFVIQAPDLAPVREAAKKAKYRELSGGWEAGEFEQRIHPIRKTVGRFVVLRHRLSRKGRPAAPLFRDKTWEYCAYVTDAKISPWRAHQTWEGRTASRADSAMMLGDFTSSRLIGKRRRTHAALFQLYLLASDLVQWFRRKALPVEERGRDLENLRTELLRLPTSAEQMGAPKLPVVPKRDPRRQSFERVTRKLKRLRPVRAFKFKK